MNSSICFSPLRLEPTIAFETRADERLSLIGFDTYARRARGDYSRLAIPLVLRCVSLNVQFHHRMNRPGSVAVKITSAV